MEPDNVYKSSSYTPMNQPKEQKKALEEEKKASENAMPVLIEAYEMLKGNVAKYEQVYSVPDTVLGSPTDFMNHIAANKQTIANLSPIVEELEKIIAKYKR